MMQRMPLVTLGHLMETKLAAKYAIIIQFSIVYRKYSLHTTWAYT